MMPGFTYFLLPLLHYLLFLFCNYSCFLLVVRIVGLGLGILVVLASLKVKEIDE